MPLSADELTEIDKMLSAPDADGRLFAELRQRFPKLSWTRCDASDVAEQPYRTYSQFDIHLLSTKDHCAQITADPASATGIILAKRS
jgi:Family of unknown function (DUF6129)